MCLLGLLSCGYVGDTLPPALYIPLPVEDLSVMQEGALVLARCTLPTRSTEDLALERIPEVDLRGAVWDNRPWDEQAWEREALRFPAEPNDGAASARIPVDGLADKRVLFRIRISGRKGRFSAWSAPVALRVQPPQLPLVDVSLAATTDGVRLSWTTVEAAPSGKVVEVWRRQGAEADFRLVGEASDSPYIDQDARFGEPHSYRLRTRFDGDDRLALSPFSQAVNLIPVDTFPPAVPVDLAAIAGSSSVELSWTRNAEPDFAGYRVFRSVEDGDFLPVGGLVTGSTFSDSSAPAGRRLRFRIVAVDMLDNASAPCEPVEVTLP
jgi:hypothetical protein